MKYKADTPGEIRDFPALMDFLGRELRKVQNAIAASLPEELEELHAVPVKLRSGLVVFADGTDWDPGSGQGVYVYYAAAWHKLG